MFSTPPICPDNSLHNDFVGETAINLTLSLLGSKTYTMPANTLNQVGDVLSVKGAILKNTNSISDIINVTIGGGNITSEVSYLFSAASQDIAHISIDFTYLTSTTFNTRLNIDFADLVLGIVRESIVLDSIQTLSALQDFLVEDITIQLLGQGSFTALDLQINKKLNWSFAHKYRHNLMRFSMVRCKRLTQNIRYIQTLMRMAPVSFILR